MINKKVPSIAITLANSRKIRKPSGSKIAVYKDPFSDEDSLLEFFKDNSLDENIDLYSLEIDCKKIKRLRDCIEDIFEAIHMKNDIDESALTYINEVSGEVKWITALTNDFKSYQTSAKKSLAGLLAYSCIQELSNCDITRIKLCAREKCGLYFYDTTRNRSSLWHAENPCGWRSRSDRRKPFYEERIKQR